MPMTLGVVSSRRSVAWGSEAPCSAAASANLGLFSRGGLAGGVGSTGDQAQDIQAGFIFTSALRAAEQIWQVMPTEVKKG